MEVICVWRTDSSAFKSKTSSAKSQRKNNTCSTSGDGKNYSGTQRESYSMPKFQPPLVERKIISKYDFHESCKIAGGESAKDVEDIPTTEHLQKLVSNLEYYFGDAALARDLFLLKHIKRQPEGYVSLKLLAGYKKIKTMNRNWRIVGMAAQQSTLLEVSENGTKIRRRTPLPISLQIELPSSRTLVAVGIPSDLCSIESLASMFAIHGSVAGIQIIRPGKSSPPELYDMISKLPQSNETTCALVEFEDVWGASNALQYHYDPPMTVHVLRINRRHSRSTPDLRTGRPFHHQLYRLLDENLKRKNSESSGSDEDESLRISCGPNQSCQLSQSRRAFSSMPNSPALQRRPRP